MLAIILMFSASAAEADNRDLWEQLNSDYRYKVLTLRRFYEGDHLRFLSDGKLLGDASVGPWTLNGRVEVKELRVKGALIEIKARRVQIAFASSGGADVAPVDVLTTLDRLSGKQREQLEKSLRKNEVTIEIELPRGEPNEDEISTAMHAVFLMPGESMFESVPVYWRSYFAKLEDRPSSAPVPEGQIYRPGRSGVKSPRAIYNRDPEYSEAARRAKYQGTGVLSLVVDASGTTRDIQVQRPLGLGLDERAVEAISTWRFDPAEKDGMPVAAMVNVEVSFHLY